LGTPSGSGWHICPFWAKSQKELWSAHLYKRGSKDSANTAPRVNFCPSGAKVN